MQTTMKKTGLMDLCDVARTGVRGINAEAWLENLGLPIPAVPNQALATEDGEWVLRLSKKEFWILDNPSSKGSAVEKVLQTSLPDTQCFRLFCRDGHAWFQLTGDVLPSVMAKLCGVDMRSNAFPLGSIAQTSVARQNAIVVHHKLDDAACFSVLCDSAAAEYMHNVLIDALDEFSRVELAIPNN